MHTLTGRWRAARRDPAPDPGLLLLRSMCHELRPPVTTLTALVRALESHPVGAHGRELAHLAAEHAAHAEAVLAQAAAAAYGLAGRDDPAVPLDRLLPSVAATVPADRLALRVSRGAGRRLVRPRRVRQILINLLTNAHRHGPPDGPIRLSADTGWRGLRLTVADSGAPTPDLIRALHRRRPPAGEQGLGLWMVRHLAAGAGGTVRARPLTPRGVAVEVTLPRPAR